MLSAKHLNTEFDLVAIGACKVDALANTSYDFLSRYQAVHGAGITADFNQISAVLSDTDFGKAIYIPGDVSANTAAAFSIVGGKACFLARRGNDLNGKRVVRSLQDYNINVDHIRVSKNIGTGVIAIPITPDGERSFIDYPGAAGAFSQADFNQDVIRKSKAIFFNGFLLTDSVLGFETCLKAIEIAKANNTKVFFSASNPLIISNHRQCVETLISQADKVFMNAEEAKTLSQENDLESVLKFLSSNNIDAIVTLGENGVYVLNEGKTAFDHHIVQKIDSGEIINTNGAGDAFAGGYIHGLLNGQPSHQCVSLGAYLARQALKSPGARIDKSFILEAQNL